MFYLVYEIKNNLNNKIYVGIHRTTNIDDGYMGSGSGIQQAIRKYGLNNFTKRIIKMCKNEEEMLSLEEEIVNKEFVSSNKTYNRTIGGRGCASHLNTGDQDHIKRSIKGGRASIIRTQRIIAKKRLLDPEYDSKFREARKTFTGKRHSEETKRLIGLNSSVKQSGDKNSQFGTCWIKNYSLQEVKKIKKDELDKFLSFGWEKGRKL